MNFPLRKKYKSVSRKFFSVKGQALIEAVVAVSILSVSLLAILALINRSLGLNRVAAESYTATYLAAEGIEVARNIVDGNAVQKKAWNQGFSTGDYEAQYDSTSLSPDQGRFLGYDPNSHLYSYNGSTITPFKRLVRITLVGTDEIKVNSIVSWTGAGGGSFSVNLEDHFMNWRT